MNSVTMISWELDPFLTLGGTAYAIRRLANQFVDLGMETRVLLPDLLNARPGKDLTPLLVPTLLKMRDELRDAPRLAQCSEFGRVALEALERIQTSAGSDAVIAHSLEGAMIINMMRGKRFGGPSVFWLHSLYDPPITDLSKEQRELLPSPSLLASAVLMADVVVTSAGVLQDASEFAWPDQIKELQKALMIATAEDRVLTVESIGCLPKNSSHKMISSSELPTLKRIPSPYVLFPGRPSVDKGLGIFAAIAERLSENNISCVAVQRPVPQIKSEHLPQTAHIYWLPWLGQEELRAAMRNAACTVLPSITEGFGLAAAESISLGVPTLYQQVGGHHCLQTLPNALPINLTTSERAQLYALWAELIDAQPDLWPVWSKYQVALRPLIDKWVEAIRSVVFSANGERQRIESTNFPVEEQWGNKLRHRIEASTAMNECRQIISA